MSPTINDMPRQKLRELITQYGKGICNDPRKCEGLLRDYCSEYKREVNVLSSALREGFVKDLLASSTIMTTPELVIAGLAKRMYEDVGFAQDLSKWAIESWAIALGLPIASPKQAAVASPQPPQNVAQPLNVAGMPKVVVSKRGDGQFTTITDAIAKVSTGTEILVRSGLYKENLILDKQVVISGDGDMLSIIINGGDSPSLIARTDFATVRGVTLVSKSKRTITLEATQITIENCLVGNTVGAGIGINGIQANPTIRKCRFETKGNGIEITNSAQGTIEECESNSPSIDLSILISAKANPVVRKTKFKSMSIESESTGLIEDCGSNQIEITGKSSPVIRNTDFWKVSFQTESTGVIEGCTIQFSGEINVIRSSPLIKKVVFKNARRTTATITIAGICEPTIEDCQLYGIGNNSIVAISATQGAHPHIRRCQITKFGVALKLSDEGEATVEDCVLTGNGKVWDVQAGCYLERSNNKE